LFGVIGRQKATAQIHATRSMNAASSSYGSKEWNRSNNAFAGMGQGSGPRHTKLSSCKDVEAQRASDPARSRHGSRAGEIPNRQSSTWGTPQYSVWLVCSPAPACRLNDSMSEMRTKVDSWAHSDTTRHWRPDLRAMANSAMARVRRGGSVPQWRWERSCHKRHFSIFQEDDPPPSCRSSGLNQASVPGHLPICGRTG
jgi:hypothetical protein